MGQNITSPQKYIPPEKFNVLYVMNSSNLAGGALTGILELVKALPRDPYGAYLVVPTLPQPDDYATLETFFDAIAAIPMGGPWNKNPRKSWSHRLRSELAFNVRSLGHVRSQRQFRKLFKRWNIDLVYTGTIMVAEGAVAARLANLPHIWHIKESIGKTGNTQFYWPDAMTTMIIEKLSSQIISMSEYIAEPFVTHHRAAKLQIVRDAIDTTSYEGDLKGAALRQQIGIKPGEQVVGLVASIGARWKRHDVFIRMAKIVADQRPNVRFVHFGPLPDPASGPPWVYYQELMGLIEQLGLSARFVWAGKVRDIPQMMDALDVLVHPCDTEPFGRVAIEAMNARTPVVGPAKGGIAESVINGVTGFLVEPGDARAFAEATLRILDDDELRHKLGAAGFEHVRTTFSAQQHVAEMTRIFDTFRQT